MVNVSRVYKSADIQLSYWLNNYKAGIFSLVKPSNSVQRIRWWPKLSGHNNFTDIWANDRVFGKFFCCKNSVTCTFNTAEAYSQRKKFLIDSIFNYLILCLYVSWWYVSKHTMVDFLQELTWGMIFWTKCSLSINLLNRLLDIIFLLSSPDWVFLFIGHMFLWAYEL
jgi:hypothetical protein